MRKTFRLKDFIVSPIGLGETKTKWVPLKSLKSLYDSLELYEGHTEIVMGDFVLRVLQIEEPEIKIQVTRWRI